MIQLKDVTFGYTKSAPVFKDLNLELTGGHIYGLLGKNGAGKTTLMKIIAGLRFANSGTTYVFGEPSYKRSPALLQDLYFVGEEMYAPALTIQQYVDTFAPFYPNFSREQMDAYLEQFELTNCPQRISAMSHGQKKKVLISFALATNVKVLLMDEPTNGLDIPSKSMFRKVMAMAADQERLFIISTHQVRDLHSLIDAIILLDNGQILLSEANEVITDKLLFKVVDSTEGMENLLYSEDTLRGIYTVSENVNHEESKLDIELLFNAAISNKKKIKELFSNY